MTKYYNIEQFGNYTFIKESLLYKWAACSLNGPMAFTLTIKSCLMGIIGSQVLLDLSYAASFFFNLSLICP